MTSRDTIPSTGSSSRLRTDGPFGLPRTYWAIWTAVLVNRLATFVQPFLVLFLVREKGLSLAQAGLVAAFLGVGAIVSSLVGGWLGDRLERRSAIVLGQSLAALALLGLAAAPTTPLVVVGALAVGLCSDLARPAQNALVADVVRPDQRVRAYSLVFWALNLGFSVATLTAGVLSRFGYGWLFVVDAAATLLSALLVVVLVPRMPRARRPYGPATRGVVASMVRDPRAVTLVLAATAYATVYQQAYSTLPLVMGRDGLSAAAYGAIVAVNGVVIVLLQPFAAGRIERWRPELVYATALVVVGAGFGLTVVAGSVATHLVAVIVWSVGEVGAAAVIGAMFAALAPPHQRSGYLASFSLTFSVGMAVGPALGTWVLSRLGEPVLWLGSLALLVAAALAVSRLHAPSADVPPPPACAERG